MVCPENNPGIIIKYNGTMKYNLKILPTRVQQMKYKSTLIITTLIALFVGGALISVNFNPNLKEKGVKMAEVLCKDPVSKEATDFFRKYEELFSISLIRLLEKKDIDDQDNIMAITYLSQTKDERVVKLLLNFLHSDNEQIKYVTVDVLGDIGDKTATKDLSVLWLSETRKENEFMGIQMRIATALAKIRDKEAVPYLSETYNSGDKSIKLMSAVALYEILGEDGYFNDIKESLRDEDFRIRALTIGMLGLIRNKKTIPLLEEALNDDDPKIRESAEKYLDWIKSGLLKTHD